MAPQSEPSMISPQRKAEYERYRREKPAMMRSMATSMGVFADCKRKTCQRSQSCTGADPVQCIRRVTCDGMSEQERALLHMMVQLRASGMNVADALGEAMRRCEARGDDNADEAAAAVAVPAEEPVVPARRFKPEPVAAVVEDEAARAARVRRGRALPKRGLTPRPPR